MSWASYPEDKKAYQHRSSPGDSFVALKSRLAVSFVAAVVASAFARSTSVLACCFAFQAQVLLPVIELAGLLQVRTHAVPVVKRTPGFAAVLVCFVVVVVVVVVAVCRRGSLRQQGMLHAA